MDRAAEQLAHRPVERLADDVPAGHLQPARHAHHRRIGALGEAAAVAGAQEALGLERAVAFEMAGEGVLDDGDERPGPGAGGVDLAVADRAVVRRQLDEQEVAPAEAGRRIAHDEGLQVGDPHRLSPLPVSRPQSKTTTLRNDRPALVSAMARLISDSG